MASGHSRKPSTRSSLPRRATKGPLDALNDPLSLSTSNPPEDPLQLRSPLSASTNTSEQSPDPLTQEATFTRDLSSLLDLQNYFDIPQDDIPDPFRVDPPTIAPDESLPISLKRLDTFLQDGDYLCAAFLTGLILWSGHVSPTDHNLIFSLLSTRFTCLSLYQSLAHIAAQESRILFGDIHNEFWHTQTSTSASEDPALYAGRPNWSTHIIPYNFRLQITVLQTLVFTEGGRPDGRRGLTALYELGLECRERALSPAATQEDHLIWQRRLQELNVLVVNTLIDMNELDTARRALHDALYQLRDSVFGVATRLQLALLLLRIGDVVSARKLLETSPSDTPMVSLLQSLTSVADGNYVSAVSEFENILKDNPANDLASVVKQNLAVCLLYSGQVNQAKSTLQDLVDEGFDFRSLTFNLATLYELSSDRSQALKHELVEKVGEKGLHLDRGGKGSADFKL